MGQHVFSNSIKAITLYKSLGGYSMSNDSKKGSNTKQKGKKNRSIKHQVQLTVKMAIIIKEGNLI